MIGMLSGIIMPHLQYPADTPNRPSPVLRRYQNCLADRRLELVIAMLPSSLQSPDPVLVVFGIANSLFFSAVFFTVLYFHPDVKRSNKAGL